MGTPIKQLSFVSFEPIENDFRALMSLEDTFKKELNWQNISDKAVNIYKNEINLMKGELALMKETKILKKPITAKQIWILGNYIFELINKLELIQLQIDGIYNHLERDLGVKRKWLEKVIILRRYVSSSNMVPENLRWGLFEHSTRKKAEQLARGEFNNE